MFLEITNKSEINPIKRGEGINMNYVFLRDWREMLKKIKRPSLSSFDWDGKTDTKQPRVITWERVGQRRGSPGWKASQGRQKEPIAYWTQWLQAHLRGLAVNPLELQRLAQSFSIASVFCIDTSLTTYARNPDRFCGSGALQVKANST